MSKSTRNVNLGSMDKTQIKLFGSKFLYPPSNATIPFFPKIDKDLSCSLIVSYLPRQTYNLHTQNISYFLKNFIPSYSNWK